MLVLHRPLLRRTLPTATIATLLLWAAPPARAADPYQARYSHDAGAIFWLMHITDTHIGASLIEGPYATEHFEAALGEIHDTIDPLVTLITGDLCDGSLGPVPAAGQSVSEWTEYRNVIDTAGMTTDLLIDVPGNHDAYGEASAGQLSHYLTYSLNGSTFNATSRAMVLTFPFGQYLLYGISTPDEGSPPFVESPEFSATEIADLDATLTASATATLAIVFGHHPVSSPSGSSQVISLLQQHQAFWIHGHRHDFGSYLEHSLVNAEARSLGKNNTDNVAVIAVDNDALSYEATDVDDPWPFVVVTTPANRRLQSGDVSPYAYDVCNSATDNPVRALVFDVNPVSMVYFSVGGGLTVPMTQDPVEPRLWHGAWDTTGLPVGETTLTVTAVGTATRSRDVSVLLANTTCPPSVTPDAGVADAGISDAGAADATLPDATVTPDASGPPAPDAGPPDAAIPPDAAVGPDAAVTPDAHLTPDAAVTPDASEAPAEDAGVHPVSPNSGCGCGAAPAPAGPLTLLLLLFGLRRRSR